MNKAGHIDMCTTAFLVFDIFSLSLTSTNDDVDLNICTSESIVLFYCTWNLQMDFLCIPYEKLLKLEALYE